jgi:hypothetical protein
MMIRGSHLNEISQEVVFFISTSLMLFLFRRYFKEFGWVKKNLMLAMDGQ